MSLKVYRVVLDANVLLSKTLRDWIFLLSLESKNGFYQLYSSEDILVEYAHNWRERYPTANDTSRSKILDKWREIFVEVVSGFDIEIPEGYPDVGDAHLHSAAQACGADVVVTDDKRLIAFAESELGKQQVSYDTLSVDDFLMQLTEYAPSSLFAGVYCQQEDYYEQKATRKKTGVDINLPQALANAGANRFAAYLRENIVPMLLD